VSRGCDTENESMPTKAQHSLQYAPVPALLREMRDECDFTQRELARRLRKPQSWIHNCETGYRRVDVAEFSIWAETCGKEPAEAFAVFLERRTTGGRRP
jgi:DNA-binding XRE family transcriptional regulator